jgi:hypothetical protein
MGKQVLRDAMDTNCAGHRPYAEPSITRRQPDLSETAGILNE